MRFEPTETQQAAITRLYEADETFLVGEMGVGKTIIALTAAKELLDAGELRRVLISAPKRPAEATWPAETSKWDHLNRFPLGVAVGPPAAREAACTGPAKIVITNHEVLPDVLEKFGDKFDGLVIDELDAFKHSGGARIKKIRRHVKNFTWRVGMTGTPVSENLVALFAQVGLLDDGKRFGRSRDRWLREYFYPTDWEQRNWEILPHRADALFKQLEDLVYVLPEYTGDLPALRRKTETVELPNAAREIYAEMARDMLLGEKVTAVNAAVLAGKLQQIANGYIYHDDGVSEQIHEAKYAALERALSREKPLMVVYQHLNQLSELERRYGAKDLRQVGVDAWNAGDVPLLALHPASGGAGLNLHMGGHRQFWLGPVWSRRLTNQTIARLWRRGQTHEVEIITAIARGTIDELVAARVESKSEHHEILLAHLRAKAKLTA